VIRSEALYKKNIKGSIKDMKLPTENVKIPGTPYLIISKHHKFGFPLLMARIARAVAPGYSLHIL